MVLVSHRRGSKAEVGQTETGATGNEENLESPQQRAGVQLSSNTRKHTPSGTQIPQFIHTYWVLDFFLNKSVGSGKAEHVCCCQSPEVSWISSGSSCINISYTGCPPFPLLCRKDLCGKIFFILCGLTKEHYFQNLECFKNNYDFWKLKRQDQFFSFSVWLSPIHPLRCSSEHSVSRNEKDLRNKTMNIYYITETLKQIERHTYLTGRKIQNYKEINFS